MVAAIGTAEAQHKKRGHQREFDLEVRGGVNMCQIDGDASGNYNKMGFHAGLNTSFPLSDDGSWLKVDGNMVVDNDREKSPHEEVCQQALRRGLHRVEVRYFDHNGGMLRLKVTDAQGKAVKAWLRDK